MKDIFVKTGKNQFGPISYADVKKSIKSGLFTPHDYIWKLHSNTWVEIGSLDEFRPYFIEQPHPRTAPKVVAIASGKGGVGKTALTASMAIELGSMGKKVVVVDADFGGPDLHEWMGVSRPPITLNALFSHRLISMNDLLVNTSYENIKIICGEVGNVEASNPKYFHRLKFIRQLRDLDADYILIDHSPGISFVTVDIYLACDEGIIVTQPEPTSFMDAFNFIRCTLLRRLKKSLSFCEYAMQQLHEFENWDWRKYDQSMRPVLVKVDRIDPKAGTIFKGIVHQFRPKLVANMIADPAEIQEATYFRETLKNLLLINADYLGFIEYRKDFRKTIKESRPFILTEPDQDESTLSNESSNQLSSWIKEKTRLFSKFKHRNQETQTVCNSLLEQSQGSDLGEMAEAKKFGLRLPVKESYTVSMAQS